ncbi:entericidin A/B family lipoprotein [Aquabacterium sp.]
MKRLFSLFALLVVVALTGCNTVHGVGQDIEKAGEAISNASKK